MNTEPTPSLPASPPLPAPTGSDSRDYRQMRVIETLADAAKYEYDSGNMAQWREYGVAIGSLLVLWDMSPNDQAHT